MGTSSPTYKYYWWKSSKWDVQRTTDAPNTISKSKFYETHALNITWHNYNSINITLSQAINEGILSELGFSVLFCFLSETYKVLTTQSKSPWLALWNLLSRLKFTSYCLCGHFSPLSLSLSHPSPPPFPLSLSLSLTLPPSLSLRGSASPIRGIKIGWCHAKFNKLISILPVRLVVNSPYSSRSLKLRGQAG